MKKFSLISLCLTAAIAGSAQTAIVDEVKHMLGQSKPNYEEALKKIQPALSDPTTMNDAYTWYYAGKAGIGVYDSYYLMQQLGNELSNQQKSAAGNGILQGYQDYFVAIPIDVEKDKKTGQPKLDKNGAAKPGKLVGEMQKTLKDNYKQLVNAGVMLYETQDWGGAYDVWQIYVELPSNELLGNNKPTADPDTFVGQIMYYQLLCSLLDNQDEKALAKVSEIEKTGYKNVDVYVYGLQAANRLGKTAEANAIAQKGFDIYGTENIDLVGQLINSKLDADDYAGCQSLIEQAIAATPASNTDIKSRLMNILGVVYERQDNFDKALEMYNEAMKIDPQVAKNYYDAARIDYNQAIKLDEESDNEYNVSPEAKAKLLNAAELFEKAYGLDEENLSDVPNILYNLYYRLGHGYEDQMKYWQTLK